MDLQSIITNQVQAQRQEQLKTSIQLTLGEIILKLEAVKNQELPVVFDVKKYYPTGIDSWRGSYCELSLEYDDEGKPLLLEKFVKILKNTVGKTLTGYKGGDFLMGRTTPVWVANYGTSSGFRQKDTAVIDILEKGDKVVIKTKATDY